MTRSRYFFNKALIRQNFRQFGWIGIIYTLGLLFALPLQMFMSNNPNASSQEVDHLLQIGDGIQGLFIVTLPLAAGLLLFRYLQAKAPADLMHSLPLRREHLLTAHMASGVLLLLLPVWLTAGVTAIVRLWNGNLYIFTGTDILTWAVTVSVISLFLFCFSVFIGICTGQTVLQGIVSCILLIMPSLLMQLIFYYFSLYLYGYPYVVYTNNIRSDLWSPVVHVFSTNGHPFTPFELGIYATLSVLLVLLCYLLYRKRHVETAGQALAFTYFNPLFKAGVMLCCMLIAGNYFALNNRGQLGWAITGYALGAVIGFIAAEMIIRKTWHILHGKIPLSFALYTAVLGLLLYIPVSGWTGYEARVPAEDKISAVYAGSMYNLYTQNRNSMSAYDKANPFNQAIPFSRDKGYIEAVRKLHSTLAVMRPGDRSDPSFNKDSRTRRVNIAYRLDNGRTLTREYQVPVAGFEPELKAVMDTKEFKEAEYMHMLFQLNGELEKINISTRVGEVVLTDSAEIQEFKELLKKEVLNMSYKDQIGDAVSLAHVEIPVTLDDKNVVSFYSYSVLPSYHELLAWLSQQGYAKKIMVNAGHIASAEIAALETQTNANSSEYLYDPEQYLSIARKENRVAVTEDKGKIAAILKLQKSFTARKDTYLVKMNYVNGMPDYVLLEAGELTPELKKLLP